MLLYNIYFLSNIILLFLPLETLGFGFNNDVLLQKSRSKFFRTQHFSNNINLWRQSGKLDILLPEDSEYPLGIVHFIGGSVVGAAPKTTYKLFLEGLSQAGFLVLATPTGVNEFNHQEAACEAARLFRTGYADLEDYYGAKMMKRTPVFGVGHSLGAKLHTIISSFPEVHTAARNRKANVLISFNNFSAKESVPLLSELRNFGEQLYGMKDTVRTVTKQVGEIRKAAPFLSQGLLLAETFAPKIFDAFSGALSDLPEEFFPTAEDIWRLIENSYSVKNNMLIQFRQDSIDQSPYLAQILEQKFGLKGDLHFATLDGSHVTPNVQDFEKAAAFTVEKSNASPWIESTVRNMGGLSKIQLDDLIRTVVYYLRAQAVWQREETEALPWDNDGM